MRKSIICTILILNVLNAFAQDEKLEDVIINRNQIIINHLNDDVIQKITAIENKEKVKVALDRAITQEEFNRICDLTWITDLEVKNRNENINNIQAVSKLKHLKSLTLKAIKCEQPIDLSPLSALKDLQKLDFYATKVSNTKALSGLDNLEDLSFYMSQVKSIEFL